MAGVFSAEQERELGPSRQGGPLEYYRIERGEKAQLGEET